MTNDVKDTSERIIARHSKLVDSILTYIRQEQVKLLRGLLNNMDITGRLADLERQIEQAISRIEKELK